MKWSEDEIEILAKLKSEGKTYKEIALVLGRTQSSCEKKASNLKYTKNIRHWTDEEIQILKENYHALSNEDLSLILDRSVESCKTKASQLGITRKYVIKPEIKRQTDSNTTILYLIYIKDLELYKVGITNRSIQERFSKQPYVYEIKDYLLLSNEDAHYFERLIVNNNEKLTKYQGIDGYTEMFVNNDEHLTLKQLIKELVK